MTWKVSIPHRYFKNSGTATMTVTDEEFQFLIGTLKMQVIDAWEVNISAFQFLIGTLKINIFKLLDNLL